MVFDDSIEDKNMSMTIIQSTGIGNTPIIVKQFGEIEACKFCDKNFYIKDLLCYWPYNLKLRYVICKKCHRRKSERG